MTKEIVIRGLTDNSQMSASIQNDFLLISINDQMGQSPVANAYINLPIEQVPLLIAYLQEYLNEQT